MAAVGRDTGCVGSGRGTIRAVSTHDDLWLGLQEAALPIGEVYEWVVQPDCGAVVLFSGTVRDHAEGRDGVEYLTYEAYEEQVIPTLEALADQTRQQWPEVGRIALLHRTGRLDLGESSVVVAVSAPHRPQAFEAARFAIDALKSTVPIWKHEVWDGGEDWGTGAAAPVAVDEFATSRSSDSATTAPQRQGHAE